MADVTQEFSVLAAPVAPYTWRVGPIILLANTQETGFVPVRFSRPIEILGMRPFVIPVLPLAGGFPSPTVEDIDVQFELDQVDRYTSQVNDDGPQPGFVDLAAMSTADATRLMRLQPNAAAPDLLFNFRWKQFTAGTPVYQGAIITLNMFCRFLPKGA